MNDPMSTIRVIYLHTLLFLKLLLSGGTNFTTTYVFFFISFHLTIKYSNPTQTNSNSDV